ncbi:transposable element Tcb1 transposase [Trichonephila clavipes]|nr:transposable element Tcb1 transposase [Trichonephila clavipes]
MRDTVWSAIRVARPLGRSDCVVKKCCNQWILEISDDNHVRLWRPRGERLNPIQLSSDDNRVRLWRPRGERLNTAFALQRHSAPTAGLMEGCHKTVSARYYPSLACPIPRFVSDRAYLRLFGTVSWSFHEFVGTRGKITANMERNVSKYHTELVCLNARSYGIEHSC